MGTNDIQHGFNASAENSRFLNLEEDEIVISGISGRFPESNSIEEFRDNLFNGIDMVTDDERRWKNGIYGLPTRNGKLKNIDRFDANFFKIHAKQAQVMDPQSKYLIETTYECIIDAGINPNDLRGSKVGVFIGATETQLLKYLYRRPNMMNGYEILGGVLSMISNRISYIFDFKGPSLTLDSACSSSILALSEAINSIRTGLCDAAIVGGTNVLLDPVVSLSYLKLTMLSPGGKCKAFDESADGFVRSEGCVSILLQKASVAKRNYATVVDVLTNNDGFKYDGITFPNGDMQYQLMKQLYEKCGVNPRDVQYVEAHGTGTKAGDVQEVNAIAKCYTQNRVSPLLIGSVKSNMGHSEPASGVCALAKIIISLECGKIPGNLHFKKPNVNIPSLSNGKIQVVSENCDFNGSYVALNSTGFGGTNGHVLLKTNPKIKKNIKSSNILMPRMIAVSGRTMNGVTNMLKKISESPLDDELNSLLHDIHENNIIGHGYRGYSLLDQSITEIDEVKSTDRPVWFIFSGMGSQWVGMGEGFMQLEPFYKAINRVADVLKPEGIDLVSILNSKDNTTYDNIVHSFVAITASQIALVDLLKHIGIEPNGIIGHSLGEAACAYVDGTLSAEQTILCSYLRGKCVVDTKLPEGSMASIGLSFENIKSLLPEDIFVACHNSEENVTISGPTKSIDAFVIKCQNDGIFAKVVKSNGYAFHSKYIYDSVPMYLEELTKIIPHSKPRSSQWISSSVPDNLKNTPLGIYCSPEYFANNKKSTVLFQEALTSVPKNAIVIEIGPHALLLPLIKKTLGSDCSYIGITKRSMNPERNISVFLDAVGKMYNSGMQPKIKNLYPRITYPVSRGTPMIQSMIEWDYSELWPVPNFTEKVSPESVITVNLCDEEYEYLLGHNIDGRVLYPAAGYVCLVWDVYAKQNNSNFENFPVVLKNVQFLRATILQKDRSVNFVINILNESGKFEIYENHSIVVTGNIFIMDNKENEEIELSKSNSAEINNNLSLTTDDIYKYFGIMGYNYKGVFKGIKEVDIHRHSGKLVWNENWISFIDTILQFNVYFEETNTLMVPTRIQKMTIDPLKHMKFIECLPNDNTISVIQNEALKVVRSGGISIHRVKSIMSPRSKHLQSEPILEKYLFMPYSNIKELPTIDRPSILNIYIQIILENDTGAKLKVVEYCDDRLFNEINMSIIIDVFENVPLISLDATVATTQTQILPSHFGNMEVHIINKLLEFGSICSNADVAISFDVLQSQDKLKNLIATIKPGGFIITSESINISECNIENLHCISQFTVDNRILYLLRKPNDILPLSNVIQVTDKSFNWVEKLKSAINNNSNGRIILFSQGEDTSGVIGLIKCLKKEPDGKNIMSVFIQDSTAPSFSIENILYGHQLKKNLLVNILMPNGVWGSMRHLYLTNINNEKLVQVEDAQVNCLIRGDLSSLKWVEKPPKHDKSVTIYYSSLNFKDIMLASGKLSIGAAVSSNQQSYILGLEFSGRNSEGRRVMGINTKLNQNGIATYINPDPDFLWEVPKNWTLEQASTIPVVYSTALYALCVRGKMKSGNSLLVHSGSGGVGIAAITIALKMGVTVYTTVGSIEKREFLKSHFEKLTDNNIANSRDTSFERHILKETDGRGVDIVLNSLSDDKLEASINCLADNGCFLEIGKYDLEKNSTLGMSIFLKNISYHGIVLDKLFETSFIGKDKKKLLRLMNEGLTNGLIKPLPTKVFTDSQLEESFRYMASGKHIGKVVLKIRDEETCEVVKPIIKYISAVPQIYLNRTKAYIIIGGLGGFGLELANWMILRGAINIVLTSRRGIKTGYQANYIRKWKEAGVNVSISSIDCLTLKNTKQLIDETHKLGPIGGIFNLSLVLIDNLIKNQTEETFEMVFKPKVTLTKNLDAITREFCPQLDYFIVFSSVACGRGNIGQSNYGFANSSMERICEKRHNDGLPGLAIQWGAIADVGVLHDILKKDRVIGGLELQRIESCLSVLEELLKCPLPILSSVVIRKKIYSNPKSDNFINAITNILGIKNINSNNESIPLIELGIDSLMVTEIKQLIDRDYDVSFSFNDIRNITLRMLMDLKKI